MTIKHRTGLRRRATAIAATVALAGCTIGSDPNEISIEHFVDYPGVATALAEQHCNKFGRQAKLVQIGLQDTYALGIRKRVSVYHCVDGAPGGGSGKP